MMMPIIMSHSSNSVRTEDLPTFVTVSIVIILIGLIIVILGTALSFVIHTDIIINIGMWITFLGLVMLLGNMAYELIINSVFNNKREV